jgi:hypothetical protein
MAEAEVKSLGQIAWETYIAALDPEEFQGSWEELPSFIKDAWVAAANAVARRASASQRVRREPITDLTVNYIGWGEVRAYAICRLCGQRQPLILTGRERGAFLEHARPDGSLCPNRHTCAT